MERKEMEQAEEIARRLKGVPAARLRAFTDFMQAWSGLSAKNKRSFMDIVQMAIDTHREPDTGGDCPPLPRFPTKEQILDVCDWEIHHEHDLPPGKIVSFHYYKIAVFKIHRL